jgi:sterol desaturase/sphingolipid hydroxylase (fatty acid hydroxylase superfamily)
MDSIIAYFSTIPSSHRTLLIVLGLTLFMTMESIAPFFKMEYKRWQHAATNLFFTLTTVVVNFALAFGLVKISDYQSTNEIGLLYLWNQMPMWLFALSGLLVLDLIGAWLVHYVQHHVKWMWQFHLVHHTDQYIDTTSANRHHPGESVIRFVFTTIAVMILGAPMWLVMIYQSMSVVLTQFNHSNVTLPSWIENPLKLVFCTPQMHRVHHHYQQPLSDTNYGNIFSFWDRMFGTYVDVDNSTLVYGLDTHMDKAEIESVGRILGLPFKPYRKVN